MAAKQLLFDEAARQALLRGVTVLAKAVSAKSNQFDEQGFETQSDYRRIMRIVLEAGYRGYVGIEWEGGKPDELEGIRLTKVLLERVRDELASDFS